ncbi:MAG: response regulator transcription factor [Chloroflexi bacterium]|nr:response regulator transcription factor [Chloroflexota bacterium]
MKKIRVFIVDDHPLMRIALDEVVDTVSDMEVVGQAADGDEALSSISSVKPDIVLMDLLMPKMNGFEVIQLLRADYPDIPILVLSSEAKESSILQAMRSGAKGYLTKGVQREELIGAIRTVAMGDVYLPPTIAEKLLNSLQQPRVSQEEKGIYSDPLTERQKEIFELLGQGLSDPEIAQTLHISKSTVRGHMRSIINKLGIDSRRELVLHAIRQQYEKNDSTLN